MERTTLQNLFRKRFTLDAGVLDALPGDATYRIKDRQLLVIIKAATPTGSLRGESLTDTEECLIVNRGQGNRTYVDWAKIEAVCVIDN
jgi:hypothetical protein